VGVMDLTFDTSVLATFALLWLAIVPTPGANSLLVTHTAVTRPAHAVALVIAGNMVGILFLGAGALLGWAAVLEAVPSLRRAVTVAGGAYLVYLGARLLLQRLAADTTAVADRSADGGADQPVTPISARRLIGLGFVTALSNAQAVIFVTSIFALAGVLQANVATGLATVGIMIVFNTSYLSLLGWLFQHATVRRGYARARGWLEAAFGALFVLFGGRLLWQGLGR
jgi:threonine/homoserine/homoserine lactone efflux protein